MAPMNKSIANRDCEGVHEVIIDITPRQSENEDIHLVAFDDNVFVAVGIQPVL